MVRPNQHDPRAVLGTVKAKLCERPWRAGLDRACARRLSWLQAGMKERPSARTKELMR
jgi:hypothetical protein